MLDESDLERYASQLIMPEIEEEGQSILLKSKVLIIGAGWAGATAANVLKKNNCDVLIVEKDNEVGGHSRSGNINGVIWEPYGAHIFHTNNERVAKFVNNHGLNTKFEHKVLTKLMIDGEYRLFSWPPQIIVLDSPNFID